MKLFVKKSDMQETIKDTIAFYSTQRRLKQLCDLYPTLDTARLDDKVYLANELQNIYMKEEHLLDKKVIEFESLWKQNERRVEQAFSKAFGLDFKNILNDIVAKVSMNHSGPIWLESQSFAIGYKNPIDWSFGTALHEMIHFAWFYIWKNHFNDDEKEYKYPHLKWVLGEMVVDTIMRNSQIGEIFLESKARTKFNTHSHFYNMAIDGKQILETMSDFYKQNNLTDFMEIAYNYCKVHEKDITEQIWQAKNIKKPDNALLNNIKNNNGRT